MAACFAHLDSKIIAVIDLFFHLVVTHWAENLQGKMCFVVKLAKVQQHNTINSETETCFAGGFQSDLLPHGRTHLKVKIKTLLIHGKWVSHYISQQIVWQIIPAIDIFLFSTWHFKSEIWWNSFLILNLYIVEVEFISLVLLIYFISKNINSTWSDVVTIGRSSCFCWHRWN